MRRELFWLAAVVCGGGAAWAASPVKLVVRRDGMLRVPAGVLQKLGVRLAENGMVCVQFPVPRRPPPPAAPAGRPGASRLTKPRHREKAIPEAPPRVWVTAQGDGSLTLRRTRLIPSNDFAPGPPGTVYLAIGSRGRLILSEPPPVPRRRGEPRPSPGAS